MERFDYLGEADVTDRQDIDIASDCATAPGHRAEDESRVDARGEGGKRLCQHICEAGGIAENARQFTECRTRRIGTIDLLIAAALPPRQADLGQTTEFASYAAGRQSRAPSDFPPVQRFVGT